VWLQRGVFSPIEKKNNLIYRGGAIVAGAFFLAPSQSFTHFSYASTLQTPSVPSQAHWVLQLFWGGLGSPNLIAVASPSKLSSLPEKEKLPYQIRPTTATMATIATKSKGVLLPKVCDAIFIN